MLVEDAFHRRMYRINASSNRFDASSNSGKLQKRTRDSFKKSLRSMQNGSYCVEKHFIVQYDLIVVQVWLSKK